jgi:hypothetical protein
VLRYTLYPATSEDGLGCQFKTAEKLDSVKLKLAVAVEAGDPESVTLTIVVKVPAAVGVPEIVPVPDSVTPAGSAPEAMLQLYGVVPPLAVSVAEYTVPACPAGNALVVICTGTAVALTVSVNVFVVVCAVGVVESVTFAVKLNVPAAIGVPEIVPVPDSVTPAGSAPEAMLQLYGVVPPVATSVAE